VNHNLPTVMTDIVISNMQCLTKLWFIPDCNDVIIPPTDPLPEGEDEESDQYLRHIKEFRDILVSSMMFRFANIDLDPPQNNRLVTVNVLKDEKFILASLLDPRIKAEIFKGETTSNQL
jgi:hypothetical protein